MATFPSLPSHLELRGTALEARASEGPKAVEAVPTKNLPEGGSAERKEQPGPGGPAVEGSSLVKMAGRVGVK